MEYLIGFGCLIGVMILALGAAKAYSMFRSSLVATKSRINNKSLSPKKLICACPECRVNLYSDIKKIADAKHAIEVVLICSSCGADSIWATLAEVPELRKFRPKNAKVFTSVRAAPENTQSA